MPEDTPQEPTLIIHEPPHEPTPEGQDKPFPCDWPGCRRVGLRGFDTKQQFLMHRVRIHTGNYKQPMSKEERLQRRRATNLAAKRRRLAGTHPLPKSMTTEYKRSMYLKKKAEFAARGLNAQGKPFSQTYLNSPKWQAAAKAGRMSSSTIKAGLTPLRDPSTHISASGRRRISKALKARWKHRREKIQNGSLPVLDHPETRTDNMGDAARAIVMAAQVLRAVAVGMKIT